MTSSRDDLRCDAIRKNSDVRIRIVRVGGAFGFAFYLVFPVYFVVVVVVVVISLKRKFVPTARREIEEKARFFFYFIFEKKSRR